MPTTDLTPGPTPGPTPYPTPSPTPQPTNDPIPSPTPNPTPQPTTNKTYTQPKDWQVSVISNNNTNKKKKQQKKATLPKMKTRTPPKTTHMPTIIGEEPNPPTCNICIADLTPILICTDNPNNIIKNVSHTTSTVNMNVIADKSYTEKSNNYYVNIDYDILRTEYEGTIVFEDNTSAPTTIVQIIPTRLLSNTC